MRSVMMLETIGVDFVGGIYGTDKGDEFGKRFF